MVQDPHTQLWLVASLTFAIGLVAGALLCYLLLPGRAKRSHRELEQLQQEFQSYRDKVDDHFSTSAHLTNKLTESYKAIHEHLASSANELCSNEMTRHRLDDALLGSQTLVSDHSASTETDVPEESPAPEQSAAPLTEPPRDYAQRQNDQVGQLDERFGVEGSNSASSPRTPI